MSVSRSAVQVIDQEYLSFRAKLIELAAALDRIDRSEGLPGEDPRWEQLQRGVALLASEETSRAERMQRLFSLPYDPEWPTDGSP